MACKSKLSILIDETKRECLCGRISDLPSIVKTYDPHTKPCKMCRKSFVYKAQNTLYCDSCKKKRNTLSYRHSKRRSRSLNVQKVGL